MEDINHHIAEQFLDPDASIKFFLATIRAKSHCFGHFMIAIRANRQSGCLSIHIYGKDNDCK